MTELPTLTNNRQSELTSLSTMHLNRPATPEQSTQTGELDAVNDAWQEETAVRALVQYA